MERVEKTMESTTPATTISSHLAVRPEWLDRRREAALEPDLPIVDPHHHLIDRPESGRYLLPDLLADIGGGGHNVVATVYLEWLSMYRADGPAEMRSVGEIEFANGVAAMSASGGYGKPRVCAGIVGHADLALGARVRDVLEAMIASGGGRFRGIRFISASHPDQAQWGSVVGRPEKLLLDKSVREGFAQLAPLGLSFDAFMYHTQLGDLIDLARLSGNSDRPAIDFHVPPQRSALFCAPKSCPIVARQTTFSETLLVKGTFAKIARLTRNKDRLDQTLRQNCSVARTHSLSWPTSSFPAFLLGLDSESSERSRSMSSSFSHLAMTKPATPLPIKFVTPRHSARNRSTPTSRAKEAIGMLGTTASVAASAMKPAPVTPAVPFDVRSATPTSVPICGTDSSVPVA